MKRFSRLVLLALICLMAILPACTTTPGLARHRLSIVCTIFPQYDWARQILGETADDVDLTLLLNNGTDLHNYQATVDDIVRISDCDLFIYVGGESDGWTGGALKEAANKNMIAISLLETLGDAAKIEERVEGMEKEDEIAGDDENGYDEHVWLSLNNAMLFCRVIADALSSLDADNAGVYQSNLTEYIEQLSALDSKYQRAVDAAPGKTLLFCDRFPFRYLTDDYGLSYYAAFPGCSAETEAGFETIVFLAGKTDELNLGTVLVTESADRSVAETVISNAGAGSRQIHVLDSMQSVTPGDIRNGTTYLSVMESNLSVLKEALK